MQARFERHRYDTLVVQLDLGDMCGRGERFADLRRIAVLGLCSDVARRLRPYLRRADHGDAVRCDLRVGRMRFGDWLGMYRCPQGEEFDVGALDVAHRRIAAHRLYLGIRQIHNEGIEVGEVLVITIGELRALRRSRNPRFHADDVTLRLLGERSERNKEKQDGKSDR